MNIPTIYVLFSAEVILVLIALCTFRFFYARKLKNKPAQEDDSNIEQSFDISNTYIDYLDQELLKQCELSFAEPADEAADEAAQDADSESNSDDHSEQDEDQQTESSENNTTDKSDDESADKEQDQKSKLLEIRGKFLNIERAAAELSDDTTEFWDTLYSGMQELSDELNLSPETTDNEPVDSEEIQEPEETEDTEEEAEQQKDKDKDKVLYIETQGKKIDTEVNKLKDIISGQENTLSSLQKALADAEKNLGEDGNILESDEFQELKTQTENFERQLSDSKMCMDVLEMENNRLQTEVDDLQARYNDLFNKQDEETETETETETEATPEQSEDKTESDDEINQQELDQIKETVSVQEQKINDLMDTIDQLEITVQQAESLKAKILDFARSSEEMMGCIAVLEDENEFLSGQLHESEAKLENSNPPTESDETETSEAAESASNEEVGQLKQKVKSYEQEIIKKDVAFAKLQDELSTVETEYQAMYEEMQNRQ